MFTAVNLNNKKHKSNNVCYYFSHTKFTKKLAQQQLKAILQHKKQAIQIKTTTKLYYLIVISYFCRVIRII